jgi:type IV pilus biogenesis protein CpaD/CtpE
LIALSVMLCAGCASTSAIKTCANGDRWEVRSNRLFWQTENVKVKAPDGTEVEVNKTGSDAEFLGTLVGAGIKAAK